MANILTLGPPPTKVPRGTKEKDLITVRAAAHLANVGEFAIRSLIRRGRLPATRDNGRLLALKSKVQEYAKERKKKLDRSETVLDKDQMTTAQAAQFLGVCEETLRRARRLGHLKGKVNGSFGLVFKRDDVERAKANGLHA